MGFKPQFVGVTSKILRCKKKRTYLVIEDNDGEKVCACVYVKVHFHVATQKNQKYFISLCQRLLYIQQHDAPAKWGVLCKLFLHMYESDWVQIMSWNKLTSVRRCRNIWRSIDDLLTINAWVLHLISFTTKYIQKSWNLKMKNHTRISFLFFRTTN